MKIKSFQSGRFSVMLRSQNKLYTFKVNSIICIGVVISNEKKNTYAFNAVSWVDNVLWDNYILWDVDHGTFASWDHQYRTASSTTTIITATSQCTTPKMVSDWHQHFELYILVHITYIPIVLRNALLIASTLFRHSNRLNLVEIIRRILIQWDVFPLR